ncbi:MAG: BMC domain-containing protein [Archangium sp.]|nr:BMC domain-containing protein [Archangium sp.]
MPSGPALAMFELESLARGVVVADALVKQAAVKIVIAEPVTPGKFLLVFTGGEAEVAESFQAGLATGGSNIIDSLHLPHMAEPVIAALLRGTADAVGPEDAVGMVELQTVSATLRAADVALKRADVRLTHLQLAKGIGGKGWFTLAGDQADVEAALEGAAAVVGAPLLVTTELIQRPHADVRRDVLGGKK